MKENSGLRPLFTSDGPKWLSVNSVNRNPDWRRHLCDGNLSPATITLVRDKDFWRIQRNGPLTYGIWDGWLPLKEPVIRSEPRGRSCMMRPWSSAHRNLSMFHGGNLNFAHEWLSKLRGTLICHRHPMTMGLCQHEQVKRRRKQTRLLCLVVTVAYG